MKKNDELMIVNKKHLERVSIFIFFCLKKSNYNLVPWCFHPLKFGNLEKQLMGTILEKEDLADDFRSKIGDLEQELEVKRNQMCV